MDLKILVGRRIQYFRKHAGLTQEQLAEIIGIDTVSLSKIETGRNYPTAENISKIAEILNVDVYEFYMSDEISNESLLKEIYTGLEKISNDNKKLLVVSAAIRSVSD